MSLGSNYELEIENIVQGKLSKSIFVPMRGRSCIYAEAIGIRVARVAEPSSICLSRQHLNYER